MSLLELFVEPAVRVVWPIYGTGADGGVIGQHPLGRVP